MHTEARLYLYAVTLCVCLPQIFFLSPSWYLLFFNCLFLLSVLKSSVSCLNDKRTVQT